MADIATQPVWQVLDGNGNPVPGAKATFFNAGTTTPQTVYTDANLSVPHPSPLVADANGVMPPVFLSGAQVKVVITYATGAALRTVDPMPKASAGTTGAAQVSFSPTAAIPVLNVQAAIERVQANLDNSSSAFVKTLLDDPTAAAFMATLGISAYMQTLMPAADASAAQTTLGMSPFIKTLLDDADAPTALATLGAQPLSQSAAGSGQVKAIAVPVNTALVLPAGGTWEYWFQGLASGSPSGQGAGVAAGGTTIATANPGISYFCRCKRL